MRQQEKVRRFVEKIWQWYAKSKRRLPWRDLEIPDDAQRAYMILVSEVMLQQTQVSRVQVLFPRFLQKFPTIHDLAKASNRDVLIAWRGMGYNSRALRLRNAARTIVGHAMVRRAHHDTLFPRSMEDLQQIPGIGPYTAAAVRNFAFGMPTPCVDVNIERILRRVFWVKEKKVVERAREVVRIALVAPHPDPLPRGEGISTANWHAALMDFGSLVCTKRKPLCSQCPLSQGICRSAFKADRATLAGRNLGEGRSQPATIQREPGRLVAGRFIPNRIIRGKIVDLLRDHPQGLTLERIGRLVCSDWSQRQRPWLLAIVAKLRRENFVVVRSGKCYTLPEQPQEEDVAC